MAQKQIVFFHAFSDDARSGWIQERADAWNAQNEGFEVVVERKTSYRDTLDSAILAARQGEPPHLVQVFEVGSQLALDSGIFTPIGEVGGGIDLSDYIDSVLNYYTMDGEVNSIPFNSSSPILYTNKDLMREAGLDPNDPPETYLEVMSACARIEAAGLDTKCIGFNLHSWFFEQWMAQQGAPLVDNANGRDDRATEVLLTSPAAKAILNWIKALNDHGYYTYTGVLEDWSGSDAIFLNQNTVFHITSTADAGNISTAASENGFELGTGLLPIADGAERNGVVIGGASVWLTRGHPRDELEAARDFIVFMTNEENMADWHRLTGYYPVRKSSIGQLENEGWFGENPNFTIAFDQLTATKTNAATAGALMGSFLETRTIVEEAIQRVLNGANVDDVLEQAKRLADARLREYNDSF